MTDRVANLVLGGILLASVFALALIKIESYDAWTHLALGRGIVEHRGFPATEQFNFPSLEMPYAKTGWLFGLVLYLAYIAAGIPGVILLKASIVTLAFYILFKDALLPRDPPSHRALGVVTATAVLFLILLMVRHRFLERPDIALMVFLSFTIYALDAYVYEGRRYLYLLPAVQVLWVNMHPSIVVGVVPFVAFLVGGQLQRMLRRWPGLELPGTPSARQLGIIATVFVGVLLASLLNPYGISPYLAPFRLTASPWFGQEIAELQATGLRDFGGSPLIVVALLALVFIASVGRLSLISVLLVVPFVYLGLSALRFFFLLGIVSAPVLARQLRLLVGRLSAVWAHRAGLPVGLLAASLIVVVTGLSLFRVVGPFFSTSTMIPGFGMHPNFFPERGLRYLDQLGIKGRVFNTYHWGGYIVWRDYPQRIPIIDGRGRVPGDLLDEIKVATSDASALDRLVTTYGFDVAIVDYPADPSVFRYEVPDLDLGLTSPEWALVYWDDLSLVYVRRTEALEKIIERNEYRHVKPANGILDLKQKLLDRALVAPIEAELKRNIAETQSSVGYMLLGVVYLEGGSPKKAIEMLSRVRDFPSRSHLYDAYLGLAYAYERLGDMERAIQYFKKVARDTENAKILYSIGSAFVKIGNDREAIRYFERALEKDRQMVMAYPPLIRAYRRVGRTGRLETVEVAYREALAHTQADDHFRRGVRLYFEKKYLEAMGAFQASLKLNPRNAVALSNLGYIYYDQGLLDKAFTEQKRALEVDPSYANAHYGLALIYHDQGEYAMARTHFEEYLRLEPRGYWARKAQEELNRLSRETGVRRQTTVN
jgi:tetratricopeptide (TPR) repeat protein